MATDARRVVRIFYKESGANLMLIWRENTEGSGKIGNRVGKVIKYAGDELSLYGIRNVELCFNVAARTPAGRRHDLETSLWTRVGLNNSPTASDRGGRLTFQNCQAKPALHLYGLQGYAMFESFAL